MSDKKETIESAQPESTEAVDINKQGAINEVKTYENKEDVVQPKKERVSSDTTIFRGALMITNLCFGVTIFTFAIRATYFGLV